MNFSLNTKFWTLRKLRGYSWKQPIKYCPEMPTVLSQGSAMTDWTCKLLETTNTTGRKMTFKGHKHENGDRSNSKIPRKFSSNTITHCFKKFWSETRLVFCDEENNECHLTNCDIQYLRNMSTDIMWDTDGNRKICWSLTSVWNTVQTRIPSIILTLCNGWASLCRNKDTTYTATDFYIQNLSHEGLNVI